MGWAHAVASRKSKRSLPDVPEGPVTVALLTDVAPQPSVGNGRVARVGLSASIGVKPTSVADSHAVARGVLTGVRDAAGEFKMPNSPPHA